MEQWVCCSDGAIALPSATEVCKNEQCSGKCYGAAGAHNNKALNN